MNRLMGLETEYGLYVEGVDLPDLVDEARALVRSWPGVWAGPWDYSAEQPLQDLRGFRAPGLKVDPKDARYERPSDLRLSPSEDHADRVLPNGARLYQDHGHPEYSTPECLSLFDLVAHDKAGERVVWRCAQEYARRTGRRVKLYKNNTDFHGMSYGTHENYLTSRDVPFERLQMGLLPFLVTRILYAGAGKVGVEMENAPEAEVRAVRYQLSQRADFFTELCGVDTLYGRPLLNARDEPHADPERFRRLHVICGDANLSEYATALKVGATALVLDLIEAGWRPPWALKDPVRAVRMVSRDPGAPIPLEDGRPIRGLQVQRAYLEAAQGRFSGRDEETDWVLRAWGEVLDRLELESGADDPQEVAEGLADRLDWAAKHRLLAAFLQEEGLTWEGADPDLLRSLDLAYHDLDPRSGLFLGLQEEGGIRRLVSEEAVGVALERAPEDTRAFARGWCVRHLAGRVASVTWSRLTLRHGEERVVFDLEDLVDGDGRARRLNEALGEDAETMLEALAQVVRRDR